jgi:hypothetical protein
VRTTRQKQNKQFVARQKSLKLIHTPELHMGLGYSAVTYITHDDYTRLSEQTNSDNLPVSQLISLEKKHFLQ